MCVASHVLKSATPVTISAASMKTVLISKQKQTNHLPYKDRLSFVCSVFASYDLEKVLEVEYQLLQIIGI